MPAKEDAPWRVENIREASPTEEEWWSYSEAKLPENFRNPGAQSWIRARRQWTRRRHGAPRFPEGLLGPDDITDRRGMQLGLSTISRTYRLPGRMTLPDIVTVLNRVWDEENN